MDFFYLRFLVKVIKGNSLLFSLVIALGFIGVSVFGEVRSLFQEVGLAWPIAWIGSVFLVGFLAKQENRIQLGTKFKLYLSLILIGVGIASSFFLGAYEKALMKDIPTYDLDTSPPYENNFRGGPRSRRR